MARRGIRGDWVDCAAFFMLLAGSLDGFQGIIAIVRDHYYAFDPTEILVFDVSAWGWLLLFWGLLVALTGVALWSRSNLARWVGIGIAFANVILELAFAGGSHHPLWALVVIALNILVAYVLIVHWHGADTE